MEDQAERLRELAVKAAQPNVITQRIMLHQEEAKANVEKRARLVAVTSGKGGVGKSNLITNLALNLARFNRKVALIDLDLGLANLDILLGVTPRYNIEDVLKGEKAIEEVLVKGPKGIDIMAGGSGVSGLADLEDHERKNLIRAFQQLNDRYDYILLDTGAGISKNVIDFALIADDVIVVSTPEPTSITDAYAAIKVIGARSKEVHFHFVMNMVKSELEAKKVFSRIDSVIQQFLKLKVSYLGFMLMDPCVKASIMKRKPFSIVYPLSPATRSLNTITKGLMRTEKRKIRKGFSLIKKFYQLLKRDRNSSKT